MKTTLRSLVTLALLSAAVALPDPVGAQLVQIKSVPVATGDQFLVHPSANLGMAGVEIALDDPLGDPFAHPARGSRLEETQLFASGGYYTIEGGNGSGRTLPLGILFTRGEWFGTAAVALQQLTPARSWNGCCFFVDGVTWNGTTDPNALRNRQATNLYGSGTLGRRLADGRTAVGVGASYAGLGAVDGVDLLYANSSAIRQDGGILDLRLGATRELGSDHRAELLLVHNRIDMVHDVTYTDFTWRPSAPPLVEHRMVRNEDRTRAWGAQAGYTLPLDDQGWRAGGTATVNYLTHPKIPDYEIMQIPRDPGHSWAFNLGAGAGRQQGPVSIGVDVVYEPIRSHTWADTDTAMVTARGTTIPAGGRTVENDFVFHNSHLRLGAGHDGRRLGFQLGLAISSISYTLDQESHLTGTRRQQDESWMEWKPSWGLSGRFPELEVRYAGRLISGTGRPGLAFAPGLADGVRAFSSSFILAPAGPLSLQEARVFSHQVTVAVPLGGRR